MLNASVVFFVNIAYSVSLNHDGYDYLLGCTFGVLIPNLPGGFCHWTFFLNIRLNMLPSEPLMSKSYSQQAFCTKNFRLCNWLSFWCHRLTTGLLYVGPLFGKYSFKRKLVCKYGIRDNPSFNCLNYLFMHMYLHIPWYLAVVLTLSIWSLI